MLASFLCPFLLFCQIPTISWELFFYGVYPNDSFVGVIYPILLGIHPREIFREAIRLGACNLIVAHNHPSGSLEPSDADLELTKQLLQGAKYLDIPILDHLILGNGDYQSLRQITDFWN